LEEEQVQGNMRHALVQVMWLRHAKDDKADKGDFKLLKPQIQVTHFAKGNHAA
jgi:hypothetical protein